MEILPVSFRHFAATWLLSLLGSIAGLAQTINPADYGTLSVHLKADTLSQADQSPVTTWGPLAAGVDTAPTYVAHDSRFNNQPVVRFDGVNDVMVRAGASYKARTIFIVTTMDSDAPSLATILSNGDIEDYIRRHDTTLSYRTGPPTTNEKDFTGDTGATFTVNQSTSGTFTSGVPHLVIAVSGAQKNFSNFWLGNASSSLSRFWKGSVAEVLVYEGTLTAENTARVGWYLQTKYALPTTFSSPHPIVSFKATAGTVTSENSVLSTSGAPVTLSWSAQNMTSLSINQGAQSTTAAATGSVTVFPATTTTYTLTATNAAGSTVSPVTVYVGVTPQPAIITEFLASNSKGYLDEDGDSSDWIEIYNPNVFAMDLVGYKLKDGSNTWTFPTGSVIEGQGYRLVFASSKNRIDPTKNLHTNFGLSADGEYLGLLKPDDTVANEFAPSFPAQRTNISMGLESGVQVFYATPTPGQPNGTSLPGIVSDVQFSVARGFFDASFSLALSTTTPNAVIRYTTDSSTPSLTNGTVYTGPLTISGTTILRAAAFYNNYLPSRPVTQSYLFLNDVLNNQVYASGTAPANWPTSPANGQVLRYGWNSALRAQYTNTQILDGLKQIPSISVVTDQANLTSTGTGIYVNANKKGDEWERPSTVEYLPTETGAAKFYVNAGLRVRGGASRGGGYAKHGLRLYFRGQYGDSSLKFPLHGTSGTDEFQTLDLRTEQNYHYANDANGTQNTGVREVFCRDLMGALGQPTTRSRYIHLYLNGQYWGIYQTEERAQEDYGSTYFGGTDDDYDVVQTSNQPNYTYELASGTITAWQTLWNLARTHQANPTAANYFVVQGKNANGVRNPSLPVYLDVDNLITYMLSIYYSGDGDAPMSGFLGWNKANNWRGMRNRNNDNGFRFFVHDAEHTMGANSWTTDRVNAPGPNGSNRSNFTYSNPEWIHEDLSANPEYRIRMADLAQKYLFNGGPMTRVPAQALFDARAAQINKAIVPDIARWGQSTTNHTLGQWAARLDNIRTTFFSNRSTTLITQLQSRGFFPSVSAPTFSQRGGQVAPGYPLVLNQGSQSGSIYYTLDGRDPRAVGGSVAGNLYTGSIPLNGIITVRARFRSSSGEWSALDEANFSALTQAGVGKITVSKIHSRPPAASTTGPEAPYTANSDFEYIELMNISNETIDIRGVKIEDGIDYNFATSAVQSLAPGGRVVVAGNIVSFPIRYGSGLPVAGAYSGALSNSGEGIRLVDGTGAIIVQFTFATSGSWPNVANAAIVLKDPLSNPALGTGSNWRAAYVPGGKPGQEDVMTVADWRSTQFTASELADPALEATVWGDQADPDGDGLANLVEFATGSSAKNGTSRNAPVSSIWTDPDTNTLYLTMTCRLKVGTTGVTATATASDDLSTWPQTIAPTGPGVAQSDGTVLMTYRDTIPYGSSPSGKRFLRMVFSKQ